MILTLKNIGKITEARVALNGITVIAGENNTGKSTIGKVLFSIFNSFYKVEQKIHEERVNSIFRMVVYALRNGLAPKDYRRKDIIGVVESLLARHKTSVTNTDDLRQYLHAILLQLNENDINEIDDHRFSKSIENIINILNITDNEILATVLQKTLEKEFNGQINNIYDDKMGDINLQIKEAIVNIEIEHNRVNHIINTFSLDTESIYIDDPFVLDDLDDFWGIPSNKNYFDHRVHIKKKLQFDDSETAIQAVLNELIATEKINKVLGKANTICGGQMVKSRSGFGYKRNESEAVMNIKNISTGLKTFVIIKTLLMNGSLEQNGVLILDEPEIHLHPEWQLLFAELIILLQKEFNMHILLNTHSPYFLRAIQVYSAKYEIADQCNYYLAENCDGKATIRDVTTNIDEIYTKLAKPLETLEVIKNGDDSIERV